MPLWTDAQIEAWLESQTRDLIMSDGHRRPTTMQKLVWETVAGLAVLGPFTQEELVYYAEEEARLQNVDFALAFRSVVAYLDNATRERWKKHLPG
jgi:predicted DNA-binding ribbon-helix-helix protein